MNGKGNTQLQPPLAFHVGGREVPNSSSLLAVLSYMRKKGEIHKEAFVMITAQVHGSLKAQDLTTGLKLEKAFPSLISKHHILVFLMWWQGTQLKKHVSGFIEIYRETQRQQGRQNQEKYQEGLASETYHDSKHSLPLR